MIPLSERVRLAVADPALARALNDAVAEAMRAAAPAEMPSPRVVRFRTRKKLAQLLSDPQALDGAIAIVRVTDANARHLEAWITEARRAGAAGVQLVWNGRDPAPERVRARIFRVLELARATLREAPVVLSTRNAPAWALLFALSRHSTKGTLP